VDIFIHLVNIGKVIMGKNVYLTTIFFKSFAKKEKRLKQVLPLPTGGAGSNSSC
jgi:hypothetical protein